MDGLRLTSDESAMLAGEAGPAVELAMRVLVALAGASGARRFIEVSSAHIDGCLYHGRAGVDFAERLVRDGGHIRVPTTLNVASLDLLHPELVRLDDATRNMARRQMDAYVALGASPTWTCAPYQLPGRPSAGQHVAWAESNAIVFANSVLAARTERYGDFSDICAALAGRVPYAGLHRDESRRARVVVELSTLAAEAYAASELYAVVGLAVGRRVGAAVPAIVGLPESTSEDQLKALGAAAASAGGVAMCHVVGVTPEASTLEQATGGVRATKVVRLAKSDLRDAWDELSTAGSGASLGAVSLGTPHMSLAELEQLAPRLAGLPVHPGVTVYVSTARHIAAELEGSGSMAAFRREGVRLVTDTCTYVTPILERTEKAVMTNSAKWAWYAPANLGVDVCFGTLEDCLASAEAGKVIRERPRWLVG